MRLRQLGPSRRIGVVVTTVLALVGTFAAADTAGATPSPVPEVQVVVQLDTGAAQHPTAVLDGLPGSLPRPEVADRWSFSLPSGEVAGALGRLQSDRRVNYASVVHRIHATDVPDDTCYVTTCGNNGTTVLSNGQPGTSATATQGNLGQVSAPAAWAVTHGSASVLVAVLDTGVRSTHQDLSGKVVAGPNECAGDDSYCVGVSGTNTDDNGHGTHVTGLVAADTDNAEGIASLGWNTRAETFKVLDRYGGGSTLDLANAIRDAVAAGASVINMSLGNTGCSVDPSNCGPDPDTMAAVQYAQQHNVVLVAAAGNGNGQLGGGITDPTYPASYPGVLSVAAVDATGATSSYSEYGDAANIAAPGDNILSTWNASDSSYSTLTGTSMATPQVSAAAALVRAADPSLSAAQVVSALETTAGPVGGRQIDGGLLDAGAALSAAGGSAPYGGYRLTGADGSVYAFGADPSFGDASGQDLSRPVVGAASRRDHSGYWAVGSDGGVFSFGDAGFFGSTGNLRLNQPIVGMAATPDAGGYWLVASDGGIFAFGDAGFFGSTGNLRLNQPIVGMAATTAGTGYWLVASDGGIFAFGDAGFFGSTGDLQLNEPVVGMLSSTDGGGYLLAARDGGLFAFGDAPFEGSTGGDAIPAPIVAIAT